MFVFRDGFRVDVHARRGGGEDRNGGGWGRRGVKVTEKPYPRVLFSLSTTHLILAGCSLPRLRGRLARLWMGKNFYKQKVPWEKRRLSNLSLDSLR